MSESRESGAEFLGGVLSGGLPGFSASSGATSATSSSFGFNFGNYGTGVPGVDSSPVCAAGSVGFSFSPVTVAAVAVAGFLLLKRKGR